MKSLQALVSVLLRWTTSQRITGQKAASVSSPVFINGLLLPAGLGKGQGVHLTMRLQGTRSSGKQASPSPQRKRAPAAKGQVFQRIGLGRTGRLRRGQACRLCAFFHPGWEGIVGAWDLGRVRSACPPVVEEQLYLLVLCDPG